MYVRGQPSSPVFGVDDAGFAVLVAVAVGFVPPVVGFAVGVAAGGGVGGLAP